MERKEKKSKSNKNKLKNLSVATHRQQWKLKVADRSNVIIEVVLLKPMLYTLCARLAFKLMQIFNN